MWGGRTLRALVNARLNAAAEEIFALFERTIAEYEAELRRCRREYPRTPELLDSDLSPGLNQDPPQSPQVKEEPEEPEEPSVKQEEHRLFVQVRASDTGQQVSVGDAACVTTEESSLLQQRQTEPRDDTQGGDLSAEPHSASEHLRTFDTNSDEDWRAPVSSSAAQMMTEADGDLYNQPQMRARSTSAQTSRLPPKYQPAPETRATVNSGDTTGTTEGAEDKKHQCPLCKKRFGSVWFLQRHFRVHTGEKPFGCSKLKEEDACREMTVPEVSRIDLEQTLGLNTFSTDSRSAAVIRHHLFPANDVSFHVSTTRTPVPPVQELSVGEQQIPDLFMDDSVVTYKIIEGGNRKGGQLLSDSLGFTYSKKRQSGVAVTWHCRTGKNCPATVRQPLGTTNFICGSRFHNHPSNPGAELKSTVRAKVKEMARKEMYASSGAIVSRALASIDLEQAGGKELLNVNTLLRQANRVRQNLRPNHPANVDFQLHMLEEEGRRTLLSVQGRSEHTGVSEAHWTFPRSENT